MIIVIILLSIERVDYGACANYMHWYKKCIDNKNWYWLNLIFFGLNLDRIVGGLGGPGHLKRFSKYGCFFKYYKFSLWVVCTYFWRGIFSQSRGYKILKFLWPHPTMVGVSLETYHVAPAPHKNFYGCGTEILPYVRGCCDCFSLINKCNVLANPEPPKLKKISVGPKSMVRPPYVLYFYGV